MIHLDTSALVASLARNGPASPRFRDLLTQGAILRVTSLVLYEWLRGPRTPVDLAGQEYFFPSSEVIAFGFRESVVAAELYKALRRARTREIDIAIAACAIVHDATLWTLNPQDFRDIPGLKLLPQPT